MRDVKHVKRRSRNQIREPKCESDTYGRESRGVKTVDLERDESAGSCQRKCESTVRVTDSGSIQAEFEVHAASTPD